MEEQKVEPRSQSGVPGVIGLKAEPELVAAVDAYAVELGEILASLQQQTFGASAPVQVTRSKALQSLVKLGLELKQVDNELLQQLHVRAVENDTTLGQEINDLLHIAVSYLGGEPLPEEPGATLEAGR